MRASRGCRPALPAEALVGAAAHRHSPGISVCSLCPRIRGGLRAHPGHCHSGSGTSSGNLHTPLSLVCSRRLLAMWPRQPGHLIHAGSSGPPDPLARALSRTRLNGSSSLSPSPPGPAATDGYMARPVIGNKCCDAVVARLSATCHFQLPACVSSLPVLETVLSTGAAISGELLIIAAPGTRLKNTPRDAITSDIAGGTGRVLIVASRIAKADLLAIWLIAILRKRYMR